MDPRKKSILIVGSLNMDLTLELAQMPKKGEADIKELEQAAGKLLQKGVGRLLVTLGSKGVMLAEEAGIRYLPGKSVKAVDTTAAGDCFIGAFVTGLSEGMTEEEAAGFANCAAAIAVTRKGAQDSIPDRKEVEGWLKNNNISA